jgi:hypothetical protein
MAQFESRAEGAACMFERLAAERAHAAVAPACAFIAEFDAWPVPATSMSSTEWLLTVAEARSRTRLRDIAASRWRDEHVADPDELPRRIYSGRRVVRHLRSATTTYDCAGAAARTGARLISSAPARDRHGLARCRRAPDHGYTRMSTARADHESATTPTWRSPTARSARRRRADGRRVGSGARAGAALAACEHGADARAPQLERTPRPLSGQFTPDRVEISRTRNAVPRQSSTDPNITMLRMRPRQPSSARRGSIF